MPVSVNAASVGFTTSYMDAAIFTLPSTIDRAREALARTDIEFDTIIGTGMSGATVIPWLAESVGCHWALVRKDKDDSHHQTSRVFGRVGERWLFVDDFMSSGRTRNRVIERVAMAMGGHPAPGQDTYWVMPAYRGETRHVGDYYYCRDDQRVQPVGYTHHPHCDALPYAESECPLKWDGSHM